MSVFGYVTMVTRDFWTSLSYLCGGDLICGSRASIYLAIIPGVRVAYELAIIISYLTSASGYNCYINKISKTTDFQLAFDFDSTRTVTIFGEPGIINNYSPKVKLILLNNLRDQVKGV